MHINNANSIFILNYQINMEMFEKKLQTLNVCYEIKLIYLPITD